MASGAPGIGKPRGTWMLAWLRYRRSGVAMLGLGTVVAFIAIGFFAPVLANEWEHPLLCRYDGKLYAPAVKELLWNVPGGRKLFPKATPFNLVTFNFKRR